MARPKLIRDLDPLPAFSAMGAGDNKTAKLRNILRSLATKNQREQPRVFYSLRDVAKRFRVPISAVSRVYDEMEDEGLLSRVRASKTILNGLRYNRRRVRAFIGLPAVLSTFIAIPDYRAFLNAIRHELWMRGFGTVMVFYQPDEAVDGTLSDQLKNYEVDAVIWFQPGMSARQALLRLADMGIRVAIVSQAGTPSMPSSRYYVWRGHAIGHLLQHWRDQNAVQRITIVDSREYRAPVTEEVLRVFLEHFDVETTTRPFRGKPVHLFLGDLCRLKTQGIIFPAAALAAMFACRDPDGLARLLRTQRVAFIDGPIDMPFTIVPDVPVDLITMDWKAAAETIVNDLVTLEAFDRNRNTTFEAQVQLRVPLNKFAETIRPLRSMAGGV